MALHSFSADGRGVSAGYGGANTAVLSVFLNLLENQIMKIMAQAPVKSSSKMTRFELARIAGLVLLDEEVEVDCAGDGLHSRVNKIMHDIIEYGVDALIRRPLPEGGYEDVHVCSLTRLHLRKIYTSADIEVHCARKSA
jgi:hypothetical protein